MVEHHRIELVGVDNIVVELHPAVVAEHVHLAAQAIGKKDRDSFVEAGGEARILLQLGADLRMG